MFREHNDKREKNKKGKKQEVFKARDILLSAFNYAVAYTTWLPDLSDVVGCALRQKLMHTQDVIQHTTRGKVSNKLCTITPLNHHKNSKCHNVN